jgi:cardiolipin synthase
MRPARHPATTALATIGAASLLLYGSRFVLNFFGPSAPYGLQTDPDAPLDSDDFLNFLALITNGAIRDSRLALLRNGEQFYPAMLDAIRGARRSINLETYEFLPGRITSEILDALTRKTREGVEVRIIVDAVGSFVTPDSLFRDFRAAGGRMHWYHPVRWNTWQRIDNRTHRKLLTVDATLGFIGGAGIADQWLYSTAKEPAWRDTMFHVEGPAVLGLVSTFSENWLEASGEILCGPSQFPTNSVPHSSPHSGDEGASPTNPAPVPAKSFVVLSTPHGGGTQAHILFQTLIQSARKCIRITTPYFLPDRSARSALIDAIRKRGVQVEILTAGPKIDHPFIRGLSRHSSRRLLEAGAQIFEYQPSMIHAKLMTVDEQWCVLGSTNFDHRSFALNDEVNLAVRDPALARTIEAGFTADLRVSRPLTLAELGRRTILTRAAAVFEHAVEQES